MGKKMPEMSHTDEGIGVFGLWHLGCVLSACWSDLGYQVIGFDYDNDVITELDKGEPPLYEPRLKDLLTKNIKSGMLSFTGDMGQLKSCQYVFLSYDTPVLGDDRSNISLLVKAVQDLGDVLPDGAIVVVSSQMPVGTCAFFRNLLKAKNKTLELAYSPENVRLGKAIESYMDPGRIIIGIADEGIRARVSQLFKGICAKQIIMNLPSAEMVKHGINAYLAVSITFANHLADLCEVSGADILDVVLGMKTDPRIGSGAYLSPGIGFSGGTLGRDLRVLGDLNNVYDKKSELFETINTYNAKRKYTILAKVKELLEGDLIGKEIGVLGITYKPGTSTLRRSLPLEIVQLMIERGAKVRVFDPKANYRECEGIRRFEEADSLGDVVRGSEMVILLTEWPEFKDASWREYLNPENPQIILDTKNFLAELELADLGYRYTGIGR